MAVQGPINYGIDVAPLNPAQQIMQGMSVGQGLLDAREQGLQRQQAAEMRPLQMQQAQLGLRTGLAAEADANANRALQQAAAQSASMRQAEMQAATQEYLQNPTPEAANAFFTRFPEHPLAKQFDKVIASRTEQQREQDFSRSMQVTSALEASNPDAAIRFLEAEADKFGPIDEQQAKGFRQTADLIRKDPKQALAYLQGLQSKLAPSLGKSLEELRGVDAKVREGVAKADSAQSTAQFDEAKAKAATEKFALDNGLSRAQAAKLWNDIKISNREMGLKESKAAEEKKAPRDAQKIVEEVDNYVGNINRNVDKVIAQIQKTGTTELVGAEGKVMDMWLNEIATDLAKLADPGSVARESEVEAQKKNLIDTGVFGAFTRDSTATQVMQELRKGVSERRAEAYKARGLQVPGTGQPGFATKYE